MSGWAWTKTKVPHLPPCRATIWHSLNPKASKLTHGVTRGEEERRADFLLRLLNSSSNWVWLMWMLTPARPRLRHSSWSLRLRHPPGLSICKSVTSTDVSHLGAEFLLWIRCSGGMGSLTVSRLSLLTGSFPSAPVFYWFQGPPVPTSEVIGEA